MNRLKIGKKSLKVTRPEQVWRSMLMPSLYKERKGLSLAQTRPSSGTVIGWYDDDDEKFNVFLANWKKSSMRL